jgi:hypothetical protein
VVYPSLITEVNPRVVSPNVDLDSFQNVIRVDRGTHSWPKNTDVCFGSIATSQECISERLLSGA